MFGEPINRINMLICLKIFFHLKSALLIIKVGRYGKIKEISSKTRIELKAAQFKIWKKYLRPSSHV